jgi:hypothetical protein
MGMLAVWTLESGVGGLESRDGVVKGRARRERLPNSVRVHPSQEDASLNVTTPMLPFRTQLRSGGHVGRLRTIGTLHEVDGVLNYVGKQL